MNKGESMDRSDLREDDRALLQEIRNYLYRLYDGGDRRAGEYAASIDTLLGE